MESTRDTRLDRFVDPLDTASWLAFQRVQLDNMRTRIISMRYGDNVDTSGVCLDCGRPFDDHKLTWARDWYNRKICPKTKGVVTPIPAEYPRDDAGYDYSNG